MAKMRAQARATSTVASNTFKKVFPLLLLAIGLAIIGTAWPKYVPGEITTAAIGAVVLGLGTLFTRFLQTPEVPPKDPPPTDPVETSSTAPREKSEEHTTPRT